MIPKTRLMLTFAIFILFVSSSLFAGSDDIESKFKVHPMTDLQVHSFPPSQVHLLDGPFRAAMERDADYLLRLEPDRFLAWFRKEAGLEPKGEVYGGWESMGIAGHSLGHYLSACSMLYANEGDERLKERVEYIVDELYLCQEKNGNGYVEAIPNGKRVFEEVSQGEIRSAGFDLNGCWVPWYTTHKIMAGLRDAYLYCGNRKALTVLTKMADWADETTKNLTDAQWQKMLACEHGGMNEVLADVYALTGNEKYLNLSKKFYHKAVLDPLAAREDRLGGLHANTQVPKTIGAARIYDLTKEDKFKTIASFFWDRVVHHHSYVNGGNSADEHFSPPDKLADYMHDTTETCNTYNMLKLTRHLFAWEPAAPTMDYYERALYNHILAHQHPVTGMLMYKGFLDMPTHKTFSTPFDSFWCCVGTGMENHVMYPDSIYDHTDKALYVNLFIASELSWPEKGLKLRQETAFPQCNASRLVFSCEKPAELDLRIRKPFWCDGMKIEVNGKTMEAVPASDGYIEIDRTFKNGDVVQIELPRKLRIETMPDDGRRIGFFYGPILLAADLSGNRPVPILMGDNESLLAALQPVDGKPLEFTAKECARVLGDENLKDLHLLPLYEIADQKYSVYMDIFTDDQWNRAKADYEAEQKRQAELQARTVDLFRIGEMQPERDHHFDGERTRTGEHHGKRWRDAYEGGWFAFDMKVLGDQPMDLQITYWGSEQGPRNFDILADDQKIASQSLGNDKPNEFYDVIYPIPEALTKGKEKIRIKFQGHPGNMAGGVFGCRTIRR